MSEREKAKRGAALRGVIDGIYWNDTGEHNEWNAADVARAICEHLGITWEDVDALRSEVGDGLRMEPTPITGKEHIWEIADALATLLEAAGIER